MARKERPPEDTGTWMNTYSDLVTLLLTFFILLFSMSSVNEEKFERFINALTSNPGKDTAQIVIGGEVTGSEALAIGGGENPVHGQTDISTDVEMNDLPINLDELYKYLKKYTEENGMTDSVEVSKDANNTVFIRFQSNLFFNPDEATLRAESFDVLDFLGDCLKNVEDQILMININGHTASVPNPESYKVSDWTLSSERSSQIAIFFEEQKKIDPLKLRPIGYGKYYPVDSNDTVTGREKNRRVDMVIVSKNAEIAKDAEIYKEFTGLFDPSMFPKSGSVQDMLMPTEPNGTGQPEGNTSNAPPRSETDRAADETPEPPVAETPLPPIEPPVDEPTPVPPAPEKSGAVPLPTEAPSVVPPS